MHCLKEALLAKTAVSRQYVIVIISVFVLFLNRMKDCLTVY